MEKKMAKENETTEVTKSDEVVVAPKAFKFKLLGGSHWVGDVAYNKGDIIESDDDLVAIFKNKFEKVE